MYNLVEKSRDITEWVLFTELELMLNRLHFLQTFMLTMHSSHLSMPAHLPMYFEILFIAVEVVSPCPQAVI